MSIIHSIFVSIYSSAKLIKLTTQRLMLVLNRLASPYHCSTVGIPILLQQYPHHYSKAYRICSNTWLLANALIFWENFPVSLLVKPSFRIAKQRIIYSESLAMRCGSINQITAKLITLVLAVILARVF